MKNSVIHGVTPPRRSGTFTPGDRLHTSTEKQNRTTNGQDLRRWVLDTSDTPCAFCVLWGIAWMFSLKCRQCFKWICVQSLKWFQKPTYTITIQCMPYIATVEGTCTWAKFACILFVSNTILYCLIVHIFIQRWCSLVGISFWLLASELGTSSTLSLLYLVWFLIEA